MKNIKKNFLNQEIQSNHIPFLMPNRNHSLIMKWKYLTFMHWEVFVLSSYIPNGMELDLFEGKAYIGLIPFLMSDVHPKVIISIKL